MIWDHTTSICHLQYDRVLREWPVIFFRVSLHLTLGLLFLRIPLKVPWMMIFFFSKWSPALLQTWPKYFSLCWPILVDSDGYLPMRLILLSCLPFRQPVTYIHRAQLGIPTPLWHVSLLLRWCFYLWSRCLGLGLSQSSPDINRASTLLDNHWLTTPLDQLLLIIVVFSTLR